MIMVDLARQRGEHVFERARFGPHGDHRARELFGFLAPRTTEHQPHQPKQRQRPGGDRDPLGKGRAAERRGGKRASRRPGGVSEPQGGKNRQAPAEHRAPAGPALLVAVLGPRHFVEHDGLRLGPRHDGIGCRESVGVALGVMRISGHKAEFTTFVQGAKRLSATRGGNRARACPMTQGRGARMDGLGQELWRLAR